MKEKESSRWLESMELVNSTAPIDVRAITVADRECDIYEFITHAEKIGAIFLIRAARDRTIHTQESGEDIDHLWTYLRKQKRAGLVEINVPARSGTKEPARIASASIRFAQVELKRPKKQRFTEACGIEKSTFVYAILIEEIDPPRASRRLSGCSLPILQYQIMTKL